MGIANLVSDDDDNLYGNCCFWLAFELVALCTLPGGVLETVKKLLIFIMQNGLDLNINNRYCKNAQTQNNKFILEWFNNKVIFCYITL